MPIVLRENGELLVAVFCGTITTDELLNGAREVAAIEAREPVTPSRLIDMSDVTDIQVDFATMHQFSVLRKESLLKNRARSAILAPSMLQYGLARMYQALNENPQLEVQVFRDKNTAMDWLQSELEPESE